MFSPCWTSEPVDDMLRKLKHVEHIHYICSLLGAFSLRTRHLDFNKCIKCHILLRRNFSCLWSFRINYKMFFNTLTHQRVETFTQTEMCQTRKQNQTFYFFYFANLKYYYDNLTWPRCSSECWINKSRVSRQKFYDLLNYFKKQKKNKKESYFMFRRNLQFHQRHKVSVKLPPLLVQIIETKKIKHSMIE